jgi:hypothetical protein
LPDTTLTEVELREGIEASRALVKQSHVLMELLECEPALPPAEDNRPADR